jgi:hypothetical protein
MATDRCVAAKESTNSSSLRVIFVTPLLVKVRNNMMVEEVKQCACKHTHKSSNNDIRRFEADCMGEPV